MNYQPQHDTKSFRQEVRNAVLEWLANDNCGNPQEPCGLWFTCNIRECLVGYGGFELLPTLAGYDVRWSQAGRRLKAKASRVIRAELSAMAAEGLLGTERPDRHRRWFITDAGRARQEEREQAKRDELVQLRARLDEQQREYEAWKEARQPRHPAHRGWEY